MFSSPIVAMIGLAFGFALIYAGVKDQSFLSVLQGKDTLGTTPPSIGDTTPGTVNSPQTAPGTVPIPGRTKVVAQ